MRLTACNCRAEHYQLAHRKGWMKLMWTRRLYHCYACDSFMFLPPTDVTQRLEAGRARRRARSAKVALNGS